MSGSSRRSFPGHPDCILLDSHGYGFPVADDDATGSGLMVLDDNHTTAQTFTKETGTIKVTFAIADLPRLSYFHASCPGLRDSPFDTEPEIVCSMDHLALLNFCTPTSCSPEYFIYMAGWHGRWPSLDVLPDVSNYLTRQRINPYLVGVLPDGGGGADFVLGAFRWEMREYRLHVFRSRRRAWTMELLRPDLPTWLTKKRRLVSPDKVTAMRGGLLGFVDLWNGILICDVLHEPPFMVGFVPLPKLLPTNQEKYNEYVARARPIRDVTCTDDGLKIWCVKL